MTAPGKATRRSLLRAAAATPVLRGTAGLATAGSALAGAAACSADDDAIEVLVMWSGGELDAFRNTLRRFEESSGRRVRLVPVGEQVRELLRARFNANNPPDIAVVPFPGLIREYVRDNWVKPLDPKWAEAIPPSLNDTVTVDGKLYGLWVKAAHKSLFWYRPSVFRELDVPVPTSWDQLVNLLRVQAEGGRPMLSIGAADGWVLTDWFENVLAGKDDGRTYLQLANGVADAWASRTVTEVLGHLADVWATPGMFPFGAQRALLTQYEESVFEVFASCRSAMVFEGDFVGGLITRLREEKRLCEEPEVFAFPPVSGGPPLVVGGDVAAQLSDSAGGKELIEWLSKPDSLSSWIAQTGFLSPNTKMPVTNYSGQLERNLALEFRAKDRTPLFDLSDQLGSRLSAGQGRGLPGILAGFFRALIDPKVRRDDAIGTAQQRLHKAARGVAS